MAACPVPTARGRGKTRTDDKASFARVLRAVLARTRAAAYGRGVRAHDTVVESQYPATCGARSAPRGVAALVHRERPSAHRGLRRSRALGERRGARGCARSGSKMPSVLCPSSCRGVPRGPSRGFRPCGHYARRVSIPAVRCVQRGLGTLGRRTGAHARHQGFSPLVSRGDQEIARARHVSPELLRMPFLGCRGGARSGPRPRCAPVVPDLSIA